MDETILLPSPNWFQPSAFAVSSDGWVAYGGPSKSLCILEPLSSEFNTSVKGQQGYTAHFVNRAHGERVVCVDISPEWPDKRYILTGSADGSVKQWSLERAKKTLTIKATHGHEVHSRDKEEVIGVGYCKDGYAVSVGSFGNIVKWDLNSNVAKTFNHVLKNFKPICMACSPHIHLHVAIGTRQGVVFVLDLNGSPRIVYKVRGQDDEVLKVSWCPQYEVAVRKALKESDKRGPVKDRMEKIRQEPETPETLKSLDERVKNSQTTEVPVRINENGLPVETPTEEVKVEAESSEQITVEADGITEAKEPETLGPPKAELNTSGIDKPLPEDSFFEIAKEDITVESPEDSTVVADNSSQLDIAGQGPSKTELNESGFGKTLPEDSFDEVVQEDDTFDIYKEPEIEEFGHKKFQPYDVVVKVAEEVPKDDYLLECQKLKEEILKRKTESETTMAALVDAMDKTKVEDEKKKIETPEDEKKKIEAPAPKPETSGRITKGEVESSVHIHKHLLATIGKHGSIRVWSKSGRLVGSCAVWSAMGGSGGAGGAGGKARARPTAATTLLWYQPDVLLVADGKSQLLDCNPLRIDCKNKLEWRVVHSLHKRGLFALASTGARVQTPDMYATKTRDWQIWSAGQDRQVISYNLTTNRATIYHTCGGFVYGVLPCPYDATKVAISVGDGAVRIWQTSGPEPKNTGGTGGTGVTGGARVHSVWQHVQGKVLTAAWHPQQDGLLAFATAEARVGLIDTNKPEKPARVLVSGLSGGVYCLSWGEGAALYAAGGGHVAVYDVNTPEQAPRQFTMSLEGVEWQMTVAKWSSHGLIIGSTTGGVAVLAKEEPNDVLAATFVFGKMIHTIDWHPANTSGSSDPSPLADLLAVCSLDKSNAVAILKYEDKEDGSGKQLTTWKMLEGHKGPVLQLAWSPHDDQLLLTTSQDGTVRVWDVVEGACVSIFGGHSFNTLGASWSADPERSHLILSGGGDCCLRLWDVNLHPASLYEETVHKTSIDKKKTQNPKKEKEKKDEGQSTGDNIQSATLSSNDLKTSKKWLYPMIYKQINPCDVRGPRKMLQKYLEKNFGDTIRTENGEEYGLDYIKIFGNINEVNEVLDAEMERHMDQGHFEAWVVSSVIRGEVDQCVQWAATRDRIDPTVLSLAPSVSFKYWKDVTLMYLQQIDRMVAKGEEAKLSEVRTYGGAVFRRLIAQLALHDVRAALTSLIDARLYLEAYLLSRTRYMESMSEQTLRLWAASCVTSSKLNLAAVCFIALGELSQAAAALGKSSDEESLSLAADIAKLIGQNIFAGHIEEKKELIRIKKEATVKPDEDLPELPELPSRADVLVQAIEEKSEYSTPEPVLITENKTEESSNRNEETTDVKNGDSVDIKIEGTVVNIEGIEKDVAIVSTEKLLKELPEKMKGLAVEGAVHKGDGDTLSNVLECSKI